jgi:hypothetical protein
MKFKPLLVDLKKAGPIKGFRGASEGEIAAASRQLATPFPKSYVELLRTCGMLEIDDMVVRGLGPDARKDEVLTVTWHNWYARGHPDIQLPAHLLAIWDECHRDFECFDTRLIQRGDAPIVLYDASKGVPSRRQRPRQVASGLVEWLVSKVERARRFQEKLTKEAPHLLQKGPTRRK